MKFEQPYIRFQRCEIMTYPFTIALFLCKDADWAASAGKYSSVITERVGHGLKGHLPSWAVTVLSLSSGSIAPMCCDECVNPFVAWQIMEATFGGGQHKLSSALPKGNRSSLAVAEWGWYFYPGEADTLESPACLAFSWLLMNVADHLSDGLWPLDIFNRTNHPDPDWSVSNIACPCTDPNSAS